MSARVKAQQGARDAAEMQPWRCAKCGTAVRKGHNDPCACTTLLSFPDSVDFRNPVPSDLLVSATPTECTYLRLEAGTGREITLIQRYFAGGWNTIIIRTSE